MARAAKTIKQDQSPATKRGNNALKLKIDNMNVIQPLSETQRLFFKEFPIEDKKCFSLHGYPGTGKTLIALYKSLELVLQPGNPYKRIVIIRSAVQGRELGHTPGSLEEKIALYETPYIDLCSFLFSRGDAYERLKEQKHIDFYSTSFLRGTTYDNSIILVDECQNMNWQEISTVMTRVGENSKIVWCGDFRQGDLSKKHDQTGIHQFHNVAGRMKSFSQYEFQITDIVRSQVVYEWIVACADAGLL